MFVFVGGDKESRGKILLGGVLHPHWLLRARRGWVILGPTAHVPAPKARDLQGWVSPACLRSRKDRFSVREPINTTGGVQQAIRKGDKLPQSISCEYRHAEKQENSSDIV